MKYLLTNFHFFFVCIFCLYFSTKKKKKDLLIMLHQQQKKKKVVFNQVLWVVDVSFLVRERERDHCVLIDDLMISLDRVISLIV